MHARNRILWLAGVSLVVVGLVLLRPWHPAGPRETTGTPRGGGIGAQPQESPDRSESPRTITRKIAGPDGRLHHTLVYRLSKKGNLLACDIMDERGVRLFKNRFGYAAKPGPTHAKMIEEQMFDAQVKRIDPENGREMPIRRYLYTYDADGNRNAPITVKTVSDLAAAEGFGPSALEFDSFGDETPAGGR